MVIDSLRTCACAQLDRFSNISYDSQHYFRIASGRTEFLRIAWSEGLAQLSLRHESKALYELHKRTSILGQIINDYFDLRDRSALSDFRNRVITYPAILLRRLMLENHANGAAELDRIWSDPVDDQSLAAYNRLLDKYDVEATVKQRSYSLAGSIIGDIRMSGLEGAQQEVLVAWLMMSFKDIGDATVLVDDYTDALSRFLHALTELSHNMAFHAASTVGADIPRLGQLP